MDAPNHHLHQRHREQRGIEPGIGHQVMQSTLYVALTLGAIFVALLPALLH